MPRYTANDPIGPKGRRDGPPAWIASEASVWRRWWVLRFRQPSHRHSQTALTSESSWSSRTCLKPTGTRTPVDGTKPIRHQGVRALPAQRRTHRRHPTRRPDPHRAERAALPRSDPRPLDAPHCPQDVDDGHVGPLTGEHVTDDEWPHVLGWWTVCRAHRLPAAFQHPLDST